MTRPFKWQTSPAGLREMSDAEIDYIAHQILVQFAADDTSAGVVNTTSTGNTAIGTFTDTYRTQAIGTHPTTGPTASDSTTLYQNRNTATINQTTLPMDWNGTGLQEMSQADINANIMARVAAAYNAQGLGSYYLGTSAPSDGDTWTAKVTINDQYGGSSGVSSTNYYLWRKTAKSAPSAVRPFKWQTSPAGLREMSDAEIKLLANHWREYIRTTGIGQWALSASNPGGGTWVQRGSIVDTRQSVTQVAYTGTYTSARPYTGAYTSNRGYVGTFTSNRGYVGSYTSNRGYVGSYTSNRGYVGSYVRAVGFTANYTRTLYYALYYTGYLRATYARTGYYNATYTSNVTYNATYTSATAFSATYTSATAFSATYTSATGFNLTYTSATPFSGAYTSNTAFTGSYTGGTIASGKDTVTTLYLWQRTA